MKHLLLTTIAATSLVATTAFADPIHVAAGNGDLAGVQAELDKGVDVNAKDWMGWTPLHIAAQYGRKEIVELLIAEGADVNAMDDNKTPLHYAAREDHKEIAGLLIAAGADVNTEDNYGWTPLHSAARYGQKEIAELLIAEGADANAKNNDGYTPLDLAEYHPEIADLLRKHGGKSGAEGSIIVAADVGNIEAVKRHLAAGVDVNAKNESGETPLHPAAWSGHKEIVELLIANGADVNAKDWMGWTPLHYVAGKGIAELLINEGADVNAKDKEGWTPLHKAAWDDQNAETADLLIAEGSDVNAMIQFGGYQGKTPLDIANGWRSFRMVGLLRSYGGKTGSVLKTLMPRLVQHGRFAFSFDAKEGKVYEVQDSFDLLNWEVIKTYTGTGSSVRFDEERDHDPPELFYRVKVVE